MATSCYKYVVALRMLLLDMDIKGEPMGPTPMFTDSQILLDGTNCEKLAKASRWLCTRYAMIRHGTACGVVQPTKIPAADNIADWKNSPDVSVYHDSVSPRRTQSSLLLYI